MIAESYELLNLVILCSPRTKSRTLAKGYETGEVAIIKTLTIGPAISAILNYCGPMHIA